MPALAKSKRQQRFEALVSIIGSYRAVHNLTLTQMASKLGMSRQLLKRKLDHPSTFTFNEICIILDVTQPDEHNRNKIVA